MHKPFFLCLAASTAMVSFAADDYSLGSDSQIQEGVPRGEVTQHTWTCGDKVYKRKTKAKGVLSFQAPTKPPSPRL